jgi:hypothetical protein
MLSLMSSESDDLDDPGGALEIGVGWRIYGRIIKCDDRQETSGKRIFWLTQVILNQPDLTCHSGWGLCPVYQHLRPTVLLPCRRLHTPVHSSSK